MLLRFCAQSVRAGKPQDDKSVSTLPLGELSNGLSAVVRALEQCVDTVHRVCLDCARAASMDEVCPLERT